MLFLMFFGLIFNIVNGQYLIFDGRCPSYLETGVFSLPEGKFYAIAETENGTTRSDIVSVFHSEYENPLATDEAFRESDSDDDCQHIIANLIKVDSNTYVVASSKQGDLENGFFGFFVYFLTEDVTFICSDFSDKNQFQAKVMVINKDPVEFDSDQRNEVESILAEHKLDFMNEYLSPVKQDNPCPNGN